MECISCREPREDELIFETKFWRVTISSDQAYLGRCYVTLKRHCGDLAQLSDEEWNDLKEVVEKLESALRISFNATMFNWSCLMNYAYRNEPPNPHVHWHFRPRYNHKVKFAGTIFEDPEFGDHYNRARKQEVSDDIKRKIVEKIKENL